MNKTRRQMRIDFLIAWRKRSFIASFNFIPGGDTFILHSAFSILHSKINDHLPRKNAPRWNPYKIKGKTASRARARTLSLFCFVLLCYVLFCYVVFPDWIQDVSRLFPGWIQAGSNLDRCWKRKEISLLGIKLCRIPAFGPMPDFRLLPQTPHRSTGSTAATVRRSARRRPPREPQGDTLPWPPPVPVPGSGKR